MGHYGYQDHDRAAEDAAAQMDAEMRAANDMAAEAAHDEAMRAAHDAAMAEEQMWIELERKWQEAHCADITHTMAFSDGLATARKMLLTIEQAHRAACDEAMAEGAKCREAEQWNFVGDSLPDPEIPVLTFASGGGCWIQWVNSHGEWKNGIDPTHWMYLPDPPNTYLISKTPNDKAPA